MHRESLREIMIVGEGYEKNLQTMVPLTRSLMESMNMGNQLRSFLYLKGGGLNRLNPFRAVVKEEVNSNKISLIGITMHDQY